MGDGEAKGGFICRDVRRVLHCDMSDSGKAGYSEYSSCYFRRWHDSVQMKVSRAIHGFQATDAVHHLDCIE